MKRLSAYLIYIYAAGMFLLSACHHDHPEPAPEVAERTVIVYMMAENSMSYYVNSDINEMVSVSKQIPENVNFIIYTDDTSLPSISRLTAREGLQQWYVFPDDHDSTDSTIVLQNMRRIISAFPARHYGLIFWSHASGWMSGRRRTLGVDNGRNSTSNTGNEMNITALRWALEQLPRTDYIFFDACFMQSVETAYELRNTTDWIVGSPAEIPGPGAPYDLILPMLCVGDAVGLTKTYHDAYPTPSWPDQVVISAIDTHEMEGLAQATRQYVPSLFADQTDVPTVGFQWYSSDYENFTYCYDANTTMYRLLPAEDYAHWAEAFEKAVPCHPVSTRWFANKCYDTQIRDTLHNGAVSMFVPSSRDGSVGWNAALRLMQWYEAAGWDKTGW